MIKRRETHERYTIVDYNLIQDKNLSMKAFALLVKILSLPDDWDFSEQGLFAIYKTDKDGTSSIRSALKELEDLGYIHRKRIRNSKGQVMSIAWEITEIPTPSPKLENPIVDNLKLDNQSKDNVIQSITNISITNKPKPKKAVPTQSTAKPYTKKTYPSSNCPSSFNRYDPPLRRIEVPEDYLIEENRKLAEDRAKRTALLERAAEERKKRNG